VQPQIIGREAWAPALAVMVSAVLWGLWWMPLRALEARGLSGDWASVVLYGFGALVVLPMVVSRRQRIRGVKRAALAVGLLFGSALAAWSHAILIGDVVRVTLLFYLSPVWATVFGMIVLGDRPSVVRLGAIVAGLAGAAVVLGMEGGLPLPRSEADWMSLVSGVLFAAAATVTRKAGATGDFEQTFATFAFTALFAWLLMVLAPGDAMTLPSLGSPVLWVLAAAATTLWLVPTTWLVLWGAARLDPGRVTILLFLEVGAAALSAGLLTNEPLGWRELVGGLLILGAAAAEALGGNTGPPRQRA
jgi:drug/metabolite transporter (DMT)-like permease